MPLVGVHAALLAFDYEEINMHMAPRYCDKCFKINRLISIVVIMIWFSKQTKKMSDAAEIALSGLWLRWVEWDWHRDEQRTDRNGQLMIFNFQIFVMPINAVIVTNETCQFLYFQPNNQFRMDCSITNLHKLYCCVCVASKYWKLNNVHDWGKKM